MKHLGRWQAVLLDSLNNSPLVAVSLAVEAHLGRTPTRAEVTAARRAAVSLEEGGYIRRFRVSTVGRKGGPALVIAPSGSRPDEAALRRAAVTLDPALMKPMRAVKPAALLTQLVHDTTNASVRVRWVDPYSVSPDRAQQLAHDLRVALAELGRLRRLLERRSQIGERQSSPAGR